LSKRLRTHARIKTAKKRYIPKRISGRRVFIFTLAFIIFVVLSLYSLSYIRERLSQEIPKRRLSSSDFAELVEDADRRVAEALFNMGLSIKEVKSKSIWKKQEHGITWKFKDMIIDIPEGISKQKVQESLERSLSGANFHQTLIKGKGFLISEVDVHNIPTHKLRLVFYAKIPAKESRQTVEGKSAPSIEQAKLIRRHTGIRKPDTKMFEEERPKVVIIVDDLGLNRAPIDELVKLPAILNFAVLPNLPYSRYAADMAHRKGWDVLLHLPMEPNDSSGYTGVDAGDGVLLVGLSKNEILSKLERNLDAVPHITGVNNHMGSKFTENAELMGLILERIRNEGLFFIDSRTSEKTTGYEIAKKMRIKSAQRDVFLDRRSRDGDYIRSQIQKLINISKEKGYAVGICHPYPDTLVVLSDMLPRIKEEVDIIPASKAVN
jgi:polysaccharide deacetylase 2 family uncharacterized protein YibQ